MTTPAPPRTVGNTTAGPASPSPTARARKITLHVLPHLVAVLAAFAVTGLIVVLLGYDPVNAFRAVATTSFRTPFGFVETLQKWVPLTLMALAFTLPLAAGKFNIGGEGQLILGATGAAAVGITLSDLPLPILLPLVLLAGILAGAVWAGIAAWLMDRFKVNEILSTVLLNFVSFGVLDYVASEVWPDVGAGYPSTVAVGPGALLPGIGRPPLHTGVILAAVVALFVAVGVRRSTAGFELRAVGANERAARVHGIRAGRVAVMAMVLAGALGGLAGAIEVAGVQDRLLEGIQSNFLLLGIIIGLIARGNALAVPFVAFGIAVLEVGASAMQRTAQVPVEIVLIVEALILLFLLLSDVVANRLRRRR